jgi:hypothetical protein
LGLLPKRQLVFVAKRATLCLLLFLVVVFVAEKPPEEEGEECSVLKKPSI